LAAIKYIVYNLKKHIKRKIRICKYCGWDMDERDLDILNFFHSDCWIEYRRDGLLYPMPENV
jgi:hypothetical protein